MIIRNIRKAFNALLTGALGAFGFSSCLLAMYGVPEVFVDVTGQVTDSTGRPLKDIVVSGNTRQGLGAVNTDENGRFHMTVEAFNAQYLFLRDPSTADGCYMPDTVRFEYENEKNTGSWTSKAEAHDLQLTMREGTLDEYRATYDIIGTWTEIRIADDGGKIVWLPCQWRFAADGSVIKQPIICNGTESSLGDSIRGTYTYEYQTLKTDLDADSLEYDVNYYRYRTWRQGNETVVWTPSFVRFQEAALQGYFSSRTLTEGGYIDENIGMSGYYMRREYKNDKCIKSEMVEGHSSFTPNTDDSSKGTLTFTSYDGKKKKTLQVASISQYGFAAGDKAPYQIFVRTE